MPKVARELSAIDIKRLTHPGKGGNATFTVGGVAGLLMQITPKGGRTWILRVKVGEKRREIGLGGFPTVTLAQAREKAREARDKVERGIDPVEDRKAARAALAAAQKRGMTFATAVEACLASKLDEFRNEKHRYQWRQTLAQYAIPELGDMLVSDIGLADVLRVLEPIWSSKTETASRLRGRIEAVLSWATVAGHRTGDNPARWAGSLKECLPAPRKIATEENQPALALDDAASWFKTLRQRDGISARAMEFLALTAARSGEVRGATWEEINLDKGLWTVPASRIKAGKEHRVPLSAAATDLLRDLPRILGSDEVFPAPRGGIPSDMSLSAVMRRLQAAEVAEGRAGWLDSRSKRPAVPHGLRSTFRDWVAERTNFPGEMAEVALAHRISNAVEAAYRRGDMIEKRRAMMAAWSEFLSGRVESGSVIQFAVGPNP